MPRLDRAAGDRLGKVRAAIYLLLGLALLALAVLYKSILSVGPPWLDAIYIGFGFALFLWAAISKWRKDRSSSEGESATGSHKDCNSDSGPSSN